MENVIAVAKSYDNKEEFIREYGWEDWMSELLEESGMPTADGEELTDVQCKTINQYLSAAYDKAHQ